MSISKRLAILLVVMGTLITALALTRAADKAPIITYEDVLKLLKKGVKEDEIIQKVEESPTQFTLDQAQVAELRKLKASEKLIQAMQKKGAVVAAGSDIGAFVIILDCSGSMNDPIDPKVPAVKKWNAAQKAAIDLVDSVPVNREVAFIAYGTDSTLKIKAATCKDVKVLRPLAPLSAADKATLKTEIQALKAYGGTPIALSLEKAGDELAKAKSLAKLILITDGMETCDGNPVKAAEDLVKTHKHLEGGVDVVGFGLTPNETDAVAKIAEAGQGEYHNAKTIKDLEESIKKITPAFRGEKPEAQGEPRGMKPGLPLRWYVWHDKDGWHVRTTTKSKEHTFEGKISIDEGKITSVSPVKLDTKDSWKLSRDERMLTLKLTTKGAMDGFDFKVGPKVKDIEFTLRIDKQRSPALIYIGEQGVHPGRATFTLPAHPLKK